MKKLFEVPIYALSPKELDHRVKQTISKVEARCAGLDSKAMNRVVDIETFPMRCWEYNHIIGYIRISATRHDIVFDLFLPYPAAERYVWRSGKKIYLYDVNANGTHFYIGNLKTNEEIRAATAEMLTWIIKEFLPMRYCVDRTCFDIQNKCLDYLEVIEGLSCSENRHNEGYGPPFD